jgi:hypothetical protein
MSTRSKSKAKRGKKRKVVEERPEMQDAKAPSSSSAKGSSTSVTTRSKKAKKAQLCCRDCKREASKDEQAVVRAVVSAKDMDLTAWVCPECTQKKEQEEKKDKRPKLKGKCPYGNSPEDHPEGENVCHGDDDPCEACYAETLKKLAAEGKKKCPYGNSAEDNPEHGMICIDGECGQCLAAGPNCVTCGRWVKNEGDHCARCVEKIEQAKKANKACERCSKPGEVLEQGYWMCLACAKRCNECKTLVKYGILRDGEWRCDDCNRKKAAAKWAEGSKERKEAMDLWDCPQALGGHKWNGPANTKVQDMKCIWCNIEHPGKKHPKCAFCDGAIEDHSKAFWKGATAFCCKACRDSMGPICSGCGHCVGCAVKCAKCVLLPEQFKISKDYKNCNWYCSKEKKEAPKPVCVRCKITIDDPSEAYSKGVQMFCSPSCVVGDVKKPKCDRCGDTIEGELKKSDVKGKHFCCEACERVYRATHVSPGRAGSVDCAGCEKRVKYTEAHKDGDFPGKYFCSKECADKKFEGDKFIDEAKASARWSAMAECLECEKVVPYKSVVFAEASPGNFWCSDKCREATLAKMRQVKSPENTFPVCAACKSAVAYPWKSTVLPSLTFCGQACEMHYRATSDETQKKTEEPVSCVVCDEFTSSPIVILAAASKFFCSAGCVDVWTGF